MFKNLAGLVLASASPRRRELLSRLGLRFEVWPSELVEEGGEEGAAEELVVSWARKKAEVVASKLKGRDQWVLGVDTVVVIGGTVLGKPRHEAEAQEFLRRLSGQWHEVWSGYCLYQPATKKMVTRRVRSEVKMARLSVEEIAAYVATGEPRDKAGAYAVQGIGAFMVEAIRGSYTNVVGLPLTELVRDLQDLSIIAPAVELGHE